jgi:hypothetical protein
MADPSHFAIDWKDWPKGNLFMFLKKPKESFALIALICGIVCLVAGIIFGMSQSPQVPEQLGSADPGSRQEQQLQRVPPQYFRFPDSSQHVKQNGLDNQGALGPLAGMNN